MAKRRGQHRRTSASPLRTGQQVHWTTVFGRPVAWSAVISAAVMAAVAGPRPAFADPSTVPDAGARPTPSGELRLPGVRPGTSNPPVSTVLGPLASQIIAAEVSVARLGEQLNSIDVELTAARQRSADTRAIWQVAADEVARQRGLAEAAVNHAYRSATELAPFGSLGSDLRGLDILVPGPEEDEPPSGTEASARELAWAEEDERVKLLAYNRTLSVELDITARRSATFTDFSVRQTALLDLKRRNADQLARIEAEREAFEQGRAPDLGSASNIVDGMMAHPNAIKAMGYALAQRGDLYMWGDEGPDTFDCSGLMWASYRPYRLLNRVSKDQYRQTANERVALTKLLPGDLLFFASNMNDPGSIHHVAMYIGEGRMVHAPNTDDVVKISTVWWSRLYGATRVLPAVPAPPPTNPNPPTNPPPHNQPPTTPPPTTRPPTTPPPTTPPPTTPPPTTPPPTTPPPTESPTDPPPNGDPTDPAPSDPPTPPPSEQPPSDEPSSPAPEPSASTSPASAPTGEVSP